MTKFGEQDESKATGCVPEILRKREQQLKGFAALMIEFGLTPLDYELVEERRADGAMTVWYYRRREALDSGDNQPSCST